MSSDQSSDSKDKRNFSKTIWFNELSTNVKGKVRCDTATLQLYSTAACFYEITPLAVVVPENIDDIKTAVKICGKFKIPVLPRGAGSSLSGNAVGKAVIIDLTRHFKKIEMVDTGRVRCEAGVVLDDLQSMLSAQNMKFAPDPSSGNVCVIGGMLGNNSGGPHTIKHGSMNKHVDEVNVVLSSGEIFSAKNILLEEISSLDDFHRPYYEKIKSLLLRYSAAISAGRPNTTKNASGYQVWDVLDDTHLNVASLFVGSEGTLGVFTDALLKTIPVVKYRGLLSLYFTDLSKMGIAVKQLRAAGASSIEFVDQSFLRLALTTRPELKKFLPDHVRYLLYVEFEDNDIGNVERALNESINKVAGEERCAEVGAFSTDENEIESIMRVRKAATAILNKIQENEKPVPFVEDAVVHPDVFPDFLNDLSNLLQHYSFKYAIYGHAGDGNLHLRPILDFKVERSYLEADDLMNKFVELVVRYNGTLTGEHGDGRLRTPFLEISFPKLIPLFKEIKDLFDPAGIMNPDIKVPVRQYKWNEHLRYTPEYAYAKISPIFDTDKWRREIEKCHGCGTCREYCPVFKATGKEEATARAKANILRGIISGKLSTAEIDTDHFYSIMDYCFNCGECLVSCPTAVNIPGIAVLAKERLHEKRFYKLNEFIFQHGKQVSEFASLFSSISNEILAFAPIRKLMHIAAGIDYRRKFSKFSRYNMDKYVHSGNNLNKVILWPGCSASYNDREGEYDSSIQILRKLEFEVVIPEWKCCNIAKISYGNLEGSIDDVEYNMKVLLPYVNRNIPVVFTSASCGYAFMHEYPIMFPENNDIKKVAEASRDIHNFLGNILADGKYVSSFRTLNKTAVYHEPCHLRAQKGKYGPKDLLKLVPGLELKNINDSCCGIAGTFGMKKQNYDLSMEIGSNLFEEINKADPELVLSGCGTCQLQIKEGTGRNVIHPITLLNNSFKP